jgi:Pentapeptide repeats (8 copies)
MMQSPPSWTRFNLVRVGGLCNTSHDFNRWHFYLLQQLDIMTTEQPKTALTSLLDRILANHVQHAYGLFHEVDAQLAAEGSEYARHLKWTQERAVETIQSLQPGLTREKIDDIIFHNFDRYSPVIPKEIYQLYQWRDGMVGKLHWNQFIDGQSFRPLRDAVDRSSKQHRESISGYYDDYWPQDWLDIFSCQSDNGGSFIMVLGDPQISPVIWDRRYYDTGSRAPSLTHFLIDEFKGGWKTLAHAYLAHISVPSADLTGIDCEYADMQGANLTLTNLSKANLSGADLSGSNLSGADLSEANLTGANLTAAVLKDSNLTDADLTDVIFGDTVMPNGEIV